MNPNSGNQRWSLWTFTIRSPKVKRPPFAMVKHNAAQFGRKVFGSASEMNIRETGAEFIIQVRTEGHPVHDPAYVSSILTQWQRWAVAGWGVGTTVTCETKLEAGSRQDGSPADQLIIAPPIPILGGR